MRLVPGIESSHEASACVFRGGKLVAAISEERYRQLSGIPLIRNTSFSVHEEPIVCGRHEAVRALVDKRADYLAIGDFWVPGQ